MIKKLRLVALALCALFIAISCKQVDLQQAPEEEKGHFKVVLTNASADSRAFWDTEANRKQGELCERKLNNVSIFVFEKDSDVCVLRRNLTAHELEKTTSVFSLPEGETVAGKVYDFIAVANYHYGSPEDKPSRVALQSSVQNDLNAYMGITSAADSVCEFGKIYAEFTGPAVALRNDATNGVGFVMSSKVISAAVPSDDKPVSVALPVSRLTNKTEIKAYTTDKFKASYSDKFGSTLVIDTIKLAYISTTSYLLASDNKISAVDADYKTLCQIPGKKEIVGGLTEYYSLIYAFENRCDVAAAPKLVPELRICATYDFDGKPSTTDDITKIVFRRLLKMSGTDAALGNMLRNSFYQIDVKINGLTAQEVVTTITVNPWNTVAVENIDFGQ